MNGVRAPVLASIRDLGVIICGRHYRVFRWRSRQKTITGSLCEEKMGCGAVSYEEKVSPRVTGEVLGWRVFAFWMVASGDRLSLVILQMLASLAEHYWLGVPEMGPFTSLACYMLCLHALATMPTRECISGRSRHRQRAC